jgi:hypothetical protein
MPVFPSPRAATRLIRWYYWATPIFLLLDVRYGVDIRIPFLDALPGAAGAYYTLAFVCAGLVTVRPRWTCLVGYTESTLNVALLIVTTWAAYFAVIDSAAGDGPLANPFTAEKAVSLALSALVFVASHLLRTHEVMAARPLRI